jgi:hypothetical protein
VILAATASSSGPLEKSALGSSSPDKRYSHGVSSSIVNEASEPRIRALIQELRSLIVTYGYRKSEIARALGVHPTQGGPLAQPFLHQVRLDHHPDRVRHFE